MKSVKKSFLRKYNSFLIVLLTMLGFSTACENIGEEYGTPAVEYGVPTATFVIKGKVKSNENSTVIPNIRVIMNNDTSFTDQNGNYEVEQSTYPTDQSFDVKFDDVDGVTGGEFNSVDTTIQFVNPQFTGGKGWDSGKTEKEVTISLDPAE
jgi:putative lipoprotein (rSAM/lipoprotein system)